MTDDKHFEPEGITAVKIENLEDEDEDILTKIKNCINEELEKSDLTVITKFVKIIITYEVIYTNKKKD